jgi:hypothetical protein
LSALTGATGPRSKASPRPRALNLATGRRRVLPTAEGLASGELGLLEDGNHTLYELRHGGASHDLLARWRTLAQV